MENEEKLIELGILLDTILSSVNSSLTNSNIKLLFLIDKYSPARPSVLLSKLGLKKSNLASSTKYLEENGLIVAKKHREDRRGRTYTVTEKGKEILKEFYLNVQKVMRVELNTISELIDTLNKKI